MKNKILILLFALLSVVIYSCTKEWEPEKPSDSEKNQLFMPMFRQNANTGKGSSDPRQCQAIGEYGNDIFLSWYEVQGAVAYRIRMKIQSGSWDVPSQILLDTVIKPNTFELTIKNLQYGVKHNFAIKALYTETGYVDNDLAKGEHPYNSKWYGIGDAGHNDDRAEVVTMEREDVPDVMTKDGTVGMTESRICFNLNTADNPTTNVTFESSGSKYVIDQITITPAGNIELPSFTYDLTEQDKVNGYIDVTGLTSNAMYVVNGVNNNIERYWDRLYNTMMMRMKGVPGEPIRIAHVVDTLPEAKQYNACRIDTVLRQYMSDNTLTEGTVFILEGGKNYYMQGNVDISKGLVLKSDDPNNPATVLMGLGYNNPLDKLSGRNHNFSLGRNAQAGEMGSIDIQSIVFEDINFIAPYAVNVFEAKAISASAGTGSGNYFINQSSSAMDFYCESFEVRRCSFQKMIRGWLRVQGVSKKIIKSFVIDDCLFFNTGHYNPDGRGYPVVTCSEGNISPKTNIFQKMMVKNSSFIGGIYDHLFNEPNNRAWPSNVSWDISLVNNTFVNWGCSSDGRLIFNMRYNPDNSKFTVRNNLFILTKKTGDPRSFWYQGMNVQNRNGVHFDFADNYSTNANLTGSGANAQIFMSNPFSSTSQGAGFNGGVFNKEGLSQTFVKVDNILPTELMVDPNPLDVAGSNAKPTPIKSLQTFTHNVPDGIYYQNTEKVRNSEIYKKNIGAPRWRKYVTP